MRAFFRGLGQPFTSIRPIGNKARNFDIKRFRMNEPMAYFSTVFSFILLGLVVPPQLHRHFENRPETTAYLITNAQFADEWKGMGLMEKRRGDNTDMGPQYEFHYNDGSVFHYTTYNERIRPQFSQYHKVFEKNASESNSLLEKELNN